ncbi:SRPBCC family protein [Microlunatus sp. Gsoil 973]|uniref:SRPBCC family protein n=1 Tax=Microlunatus sp. Gsoil 973 TaxID=2672569 RepID=UPI0012B4C320|nr:SRPBCC family protein [Microlunatus sp. Gsoil 973]QGN32308.1 ATPase [Microlunatus sp. Gsoil 973]
MTQTVNEQQLARRRVIKAPASAIFTVLADPSRHQDTTPEDWVRDAVTPEPITGVDQVFVINMFHINAGGHYVMHNRVAVFEQDRAIAWDPGQPDQDGNPQVGGWRWRYDLEPRDDGTEVTLTYDWSACLPPLRDAIRFPPFGPEFLDASLAALERAVTC